MVSQRNDLEHIFVLQIIVVLKIIEQGFLVANKIVALQMIVHMLCRNIFAANFQEILLKIF